MSFYKGLALITMLLTFGMSIAGEYVADYKAQEPRFIAERLVWDLVKEECEEAGFHPGFVYALIYAESGFDAHYHNAHYRGMMGLSKTAWGYVAKRGYYEVYNWQVNIKHGVDYLKLLREKLREDHVFSYPMLAACYYYGYQNVRDANFRISGLEPTDNVLYERLMAGSLQPLRIPSGGVKLLELPVPEKR